MFADNLTDYTETITLAKDIQSSTLTWKPHWEPKPNRETWTHELTQVLNPWTKLMT